MDKKMLSATLIAALLGATFAAYVFWQYNHQKSELVLARNPPAASPPAAPAPTMPPTTEASDLGGRQLTKSADTSRNGYKMLT